MVVSVIIPVYKVEQYIQRCLESVIAQECDDFSIECILIDDCSPDHSMDIVEKQIEAYDGTGVVGRGDGLVAYGDVVRVDEVDVAAYPQPLPKGGVTGI